MSNAECKCGRATRDEAYVCDQCADDLGRALADVAWLAPELEVSITRQRGIDYRAGAREPSPGASVIAWAPAEARARLRAVLVSWALLCASEGVRTSDARPGLPADDLMALSRWLRYRVDGLALHERGSQAVDQITDAVAACCRLIDRPPDQQYLGLCPACGKGRLYVAAGGRYARCNGCGVDAEAEAIRTQLLTDLDDRLCTAAEIARLVTYLGLRANRQQVNDQIRQWHHRERITREAYIGEDSAFRFGIVWRLLVAEDERRAG